jgi:hypothetical protein
MIIKRHLNTALLPLAVSTITIAAQAVELKVSTNMPPVDVHGFVSQGYLYSGSYDYLSPDTTGGSSKFFEWGLNGSMNPFPRTHIAAQGFTFDVGNAGKYEPVLDYALADYTFADWIGIRGGRIRRPEGLYNHIQDVDLARTWVLLPQGMYPARWRDMYTTLDGGELFGTIPLRKAGSLSYELYSGLQRPQLNGGLALQKENLPPFRPLVWINSPIISGGQVWWNTPLTGLRTGAALNYVSDMTFRNDLGRQSKGSIFVQHYSLEYLWNSWTFQAEYLTYIVDYHNSGGGLPNTVVRIRPDTWYASAAYRFNKYLEAGAYYTEYYPATNNRNGAGAAVPSDSYQKDAAISLRVDPTDWWTLKIEGHYINGTGQLYDNVANPSRSDNGWFMLALKTTFSF